MHYNQQDRLFDIHLSNSPTRTHTSPRPPPPASPDSTFLTLLHQPSSSRHQHICTRPRVPTPPHQPSTTDTSPPSPHQRSTTHTAPTSPHQPSTSGVAPASPYQPSRTDTAPTPTLPYPRGPPKNSPPAPPSHFPPTSPTPYPPTPPQPQVPAHTPCTRDPAAASPPSKTHTSASPSPPDPDTTRNRSPPPFLKSAPPTATSFESLQPALTTAASSIASFTAPSPLARAPPHRPLSAAPTTFTSNFPRVAVTAPPSPSTSSSASVHYRAPPHISTMTSSSALFRTAQSPASTSISMSKRPEVPSIAPAPTTNSMYSSTLNSTLTLNANLAVPLKLTYDGPSLRGVTRRGKEDPAGRVLGGGVESPVPRPRRKAPTFDGTQMRESG